MELDKVTVAVVFRNLHEYDNQPPGACSGFDHRLLRIAVRDSNATKNPWLHAREMAEAAFRTSTAFVEQDFGGTERVGITPTLSDQVTC